MATVICLASSSSSSSCYSNCENKNNGHDIVVKASVQKQSIPQPLAKLTSLLSTTFKPLLQELEKTKMAAYIKRSSLKMLDVFVDSTFQFVDQPFLPSQKNFRPVKEIGEIVEVDCVQGEIPSDFPQGVYVRNGANPMFGELISVVSSIFGRANEVWVEGDGMIHALYLNKELNSGKWNISYKNKYVETDTYKIEKQMNRPILFPVVEGDSLLLLLAPIINMLRVGVASKMVSNTAVFEHAGKYYSIAENSLPQEIDIFSLETFHNYDVHGTWTPPFTAHPKKDPKSGEMVIMRSTPIKPYFVVGVISADGKKLNHVVDINLERSAFSHELGITQKYNIIINHPLIASLDGLYRGEQIFKFEKEDYARIGVMPRYGDSNSIRWFDIQPHCIFHLFNCFEDGDEVVVRGCKAKEAILPGPDWGEDKFEWFSRGFNFKPKKNISSDEKNIFNSTKKDGFLFASAHEWRLNMKTGEVNEKAVTGNHLSMDFPFINEDFVGLKHKYGYTHVLDSIASSTCGRTKYGSLAKLYFDESNSEYKEFCGDLKEGEVTQLVKVEYHNLGKNNFCTGATFVSREGAIAEDDGWIVAFVHNEDTDLSHVVVVDANKFEDEAVAKIAIPQRVPYGYHGAFFATSPP